MKIDTAEWERGYGLGWKKAAGLAEGKTKGVGPSFDAGAEEARKDWERYAEAHIRGQRYPDWPRLVGGAA